MQLERNSHVNHETEATQGCISANWMKAVTKSPGDSDIVGIIYKYCNERLSNQAVKATKLCSNGNNS